MGGGMGGVMKTFDILALCMVAVVVSFLGFLVENVWLALTQGYMDNRNMYLPFLLGYGVAILLIFFLFRTPEQLWFLGRTVLTQSRLMRLWLYFAGVMLCVCTGEILLGKLVEKTCHFYWWDYTRIPLHITRYTSVPTSISYSAAITVFMDRFFEPLHDCFLEWDRDSLMFAVTVMGLLLVGDFACNAVKMYKTRGMVRRWRIDMTGSRVYKRLHA